MVIGDRTMLFSYIHYRELQSAGGLDGTIVNYNEASIVARAARAGGPQNQSLWYTSLHFNVTELYFINITGLK